MYGREQLISQGMCGDAVCSSDITIRDLESAAAKSNISISSLMNEAYRAVGDPDGIYGCATERCGSTVARSVMPVYAHQCDRHQTA